MNKHPLIEFLGRHPEYRRLREALMKNEGAAAVFGLGEAHRAHMAAALFCDTGKTVLVVTANEASAMRIREEAAVYAPPQSICPRAICRLPDAASRRRPGLRRAA